MADGKDRMEQVMNHGMDMAKKLLAKNGEFHSIQLYFRGRSPNEARFAVTAVLQLDNFIHCSFYLDQKNHKNN